MDFCRHTGCFNCFYERFTLDYWFNEHLMKTLKNTWFIAFSIIWFIIFCCTKMEIYFPRLIQFYAIDLLALPILGNLSLAFYRWITKEEQIKLPIYSLIFLVVGLSLVFEYQMPKHHPRYVADVWDIVMYILGGLFFQLVMNKTSPITLHASK